MIKAYLNELIISLTIAFMVFYPPNIGVIVFGLTLSFLISLKVLEHRAQKEPPEFAKLREELRDVKSKVDQLILGRNR